MVRNVSFILVFGLIASLAGCAQIAKENTSPLGSKIVNEVAAEDFKQDRQNSKWLAEYCNQVISETAFMPTVYERERGPRQVLEPVNSDRFPTNSPIETCNYDFYFWPMAKDVYQNLGLDYRYNQKAWDELHTLLGVWISSQLQTQGWTEVETDTESTSKKFANLSFERVNEYENIQEYLDLYMTKDEEVVYELVVLAE